MGGKHVYSIIKDCARQKHCNEIKGLKFVVDFAFQLYRIMIGIKNKNRKDQKKRIHEYIDINLVDPSNNKSIDYLIEYEDKVAHLIATCSFVELLIEKCIFAIIVYDGRAPKLKRKKLEERRKKRDQACDEMAKIDDKTSLDYIKQHKRCVGLRNSHYKESRELMIAMGFCTVQAPCEGESQCAAIASSIGDIEGVIGEDSDILIFQGSKIIKDFTRKNTFITEIKLSDILVSLCDKANLILKSNGEENIRKFLQDNFIDYCIIQGTDYNEPICDADPNELFELFVQSKFDVIKLLDNLRQNDKYSGTVRQNFEIEWIEARKNYLNTEVIDPQSIDRTLKKPDLDKMIEILHNKNKFNIKFVHKLHSSLMHMYNLYYNIKFDSEWYGSFRSYQIKFQNAKLKKKDKKSICHRDVIAHI